MSAAPALSTSSPQFDAGAPFSEVIQSLSPRHVARHSKGQRRLALHALASRSQLQALRRRLPPFRRISVSSFPQRIILQPYRPVLFAVSANG